jgi:hypothetical protein
MESSHDLTQNKEYFFISSAWSYSRFSTRSCLPYACLDHEFFSPKSIKPVLLAILRQTGRAFLLPNNRNQKYRGAESMSVREDKKEKKFSEDCIEEEDFGLERKMGYTISGIGLFLIFLKLVSSV